MDFHKLEAVMKYVKLKPLVCYLNDLESYIRLNAHLIVDYGERFRYGEAISSGFVESAINQVIAKRFNKRQQTQWSRSGAHNLLLIRAKVLNEDWERKFGKHYPHFRQPAESLKTAA